MMLHSHSIPVPCAHLLLLLPPLPRTDTVRRTGRESGTNASHARAPAAAAAAGRVAGTGTGAISVPYQSPTLSPAAALRDGVISSPPSPSAVASPGQAPVPEPSAVRAFTGRQRGVGSLSRPLIAMLAVVGAALLVVLYARLVRRAFRAARRRWRVWRRRRRLLMPPDGSPANDSFVSFTTYDNYYHTFSPYGLNDAAIKLLPSAQFLRAEAARVSGAGTRECVVCLLEFADGDELRALPLCVHTFHADCIDVWLWAHASCPLCRAAVALPPPVASLLQSARRVRPSLDDLLFLHPVPLPPPGPAALPEITPDSPDQLNPTPAAAPQHK